MERTLPCVAKNVRDPYQIYLLMSYVKKLLLANSLLSQFLNSQISMLVNLKNQVSCISQALLVKN